MSDKKRTKSLWEPKDEEGLKGILSKISSSANLQSLNDSFCEAVSVFPNYYDLFHLAMQDKHREISGIAPASSFESKERKARKMWIWLFCFNWFCVLLFIFVQSLELGFEFAAPFILLFGIMAWSIYHCAYKKKGTKWLSFIVFVGPFLQGSQLMKRAMHEWLWWDLAIDIALFGLYWYASLRLRRVNFEAKTKRQLVELKNRMAPA
jgi:hypothetical protein